MVAHAMIVAVGLSASLPALCAKKVAEPGVTPIQAELMSDLNARLLKAGAPIFARVTSEWSGTNCFLRKGAVLQAHIVSVSPYNRATKLSELDLAFTRAQCLASQMGGLELLLAALAAPPRDSDLGILSDPVPMNTAGASGISNLGYMQMTANVDLKLGLDSSSYDFHNLPRMHMGDVTGIHGLKLSVGTGTENSSVLTSRGHDVALEKHTVLLLIPSEGVYPKPASASAPVAPASTASAATATAPSPLSASVARPPAEPVDDTDLCDPAHCNVAVAPGDEIDAGKPEITFAARPLGYAPRPQKQMTEFESDDALAWLGPGHLLVAFNPHVLATRHSLGPAGFTRRIIRAALLDTNAHKITRSVDWELPDNADYLWPLADNRVLVHVGSELRVYGDGLKIVQRIGLIGPLAFVRVTPDGNFIAIGQIHERHSPELHAQLKESLGAEPEEDVTVTVLNRGFDTIAKSDARSNILPPTLLNEGQVRLLALPSHRYRVDLFTWDSKTTVLDRFGSGCAPQLTSLAPDLLFLSSCNVHNGMLEYRVLNSSGKLTLKGFSTPDDLSDNAKGTATPGAFVVKTVRSSVVRPGYPFSESSLESEELGVYRAEDGKRLFGVHLGSPTSSVDGYALAADGSQLAVLTRDQVSIYPVDRK